MIAVVKGLLVREVMRIENSEILLIFYQLFPTTSVRNVW